MYVNSILPIYFVKTKGKVQSLPKKIYFRPLLAKRNIKISCACRGGEGSIGGGGGDFLNLLRRILKALAPIHKIYY
jgi:hypothetical protein